MYFSKTVYLIFMILTIRILLSNARNMQSNPSHGSAKYHEYIEGLLKLKGRMLSHAMKMVVKEDEDEYDDDEKGSRANEENFIDLGSHPIVTPRTLHAEDFTMPPRENITSSTTTEEQPVTMATTTHSQYYNVKYGKKDNDREEETTTRKHPLETEEAMIESSSNEMKSRHDGNEHAEENREEEIMTRKHGLDCEEAATQRHHHKCEHDEGNQEEEQHTTKKHCFQNEETVTERHDNKAKNQHSNEDHEEATTIRKSEIETEYANKCHNKTKAEPKSEDHEEDTPTKKTDPEREEQSTQRCHNKTIENSEEEMDKRKEEASTKIISCTCNRGGIETTTAGHEDKDSSEKKHGEHETSIERPHPKSNDTSTVRNEGDELIRKIALELLRSQVLHRIEETTSENGGEEQAGDGTPEDEEAAEEGSETPEEESESEEETQKNETCEPEEEEVSNQPPFKLESTTAVTRKQQNDSEDEQEKEEHSERTTAHEPNVETNTHRQNFKLLILKPIKSGKWSLEEVERNTTRGPDGEEITDSEVPHTTCGPDEEEITYPAEPRATCGPDEEEITNPAEPSVDHETYTAKPTNPINEGGTTEIVYNNAITPTIGVLTERPADIPLTNDTTFTTPTSIEAYPTMCFPVTEPQVNSTPETSTQASPQNVTVPPSNDTQTTAAPAYQNISSAVTQTPQNASMENTTQSLQTTSAPATQPPIGDAQETTTQAQTAGNFSQEVTTTMRQPNNTEEVTTQSLSGYATMCYPVTEAPASTTAKPSSQTNTQKLRRHLKRRWKAQKEFHAPSMRAKLSRVVRELRERENRAVDKSKMLTLVHYAGQPHYQRYYLRGLKDTESSEGRCKKHENNYYPNEEEDPKFKSSSGNLELLDYEEVRDDDQSGIFEDAMKVRLPFCATKPPPPQPMAQKCAGKNHDIQHFRHQTTKKPISDQCKKCENEKYTPPYIVPIPNIDTESNDVCKSSDGVDDFTFETNFGSKNKFDTSNSCNDFGIEQFTKKSQAQISLEKFRKEQQADHIQQKLSFMGRLLGRNKNCGNNKMASHLPNALPTILPAEKSTVSKAKSFFPLRKLFDKWFKPKPNCDKCHQKVKLKDLLHHKDSIKRLKDGTTKTKRHKSEQLRNVRHHNCDNAIRRRHRANFGSKLQRKHAKKRSDNTRNSKAKKATQANFTEHRKRRRHALMGRRPRRTSICEESNNHMNWRNGDVPDLHQKWNGNFESDDYNIF